VATIWTQVALAKPEKPIFSELPPEGGSPVASAQSRSVPALSPPVTIVAQASTPRPAEIDQAAAAHKDMENRLGGKKLYRFKAEDLDLKTALAILARDNNLNIVPDNDVNGVVTLDVHDLPLEMMMRALLDASDCSWREENGLIRVRNYETRTFTVDYLRLSRKGVGQSSAMLASGTSGQSGQIGGGGGGVGQGTGAPGVAGSSGAGSSSVNILADNPIDFWKELKEELAFMLTDQGKRTLAVNMTAGIVQVTDRPSALKNVEHFLKGVDKTVHRQVDIEAKIYDVTLNNQFEFGIDWVHVAEAYGGAMGFGASTLPAAIGGGSLQNSALGGINRLVNIGSTDPGGNLTTLVFQNFNTAAAVTALSQQGQVEVISKPRIRTLNNQTALIKVGEELPFFNTSTTIVPGTTAGTSTVLEQSLITSITVGTILSITPQISDDEWVCLDISPVLTSLKGVVFAGGTNSTGSSGGSGASAPDLDTKQASTLVRVRDGVTVVLGGLIQTENSKSVRKVPLLGDIPLLGKLFTGTFSFKQKKELVMFVTPHIVKEDEPTIASAPEPRSMK
jgi:MSHA type pilus biogenesis protein MshL